MDPLVIFHHIPKTAGRSLQAVVRANYPRDEFAQLYGTPHHLEWCRLWWESLPDAERTSLRCIAGHNANRLIPVIDRPFRAFCVVRHPVERVLSLWSFLRSYDERWRRRSYVDTWRGKDNAELALERTGWAVEDIYRDAERRAREARRPHPAMRQFFDGQVRTLAAGYPELESQSSCAPEAAAPDNATLAPLLERMSHDYTVGVHALMEDSVRGFAEVFGWERIFLPRKNVSTGRRRGEDLSVETTELILAHNQLDLALYEHYAP